MQNIIKPTPFSFLMKIVMVYPDPKSEKGISAYSERLIENIRKQGLEIEDCTFLQGKPFNIFPKIPKLFGNKIIHIQHEYNLMGGYGIPYFIFLGVLGLFKKKGLIVTMHTVLSKKEEFSGNKLKGILRKVLYVLQNKWINTTSAKIIVHSEAFKEILIKDYKIPKEKVIVFPHPILEDIPLTPKVQAKKTLGLDGDVYLMIGTFIDLHGQDIVINQAEKIGKTILIATNPTVVNYRNEEKIKNYLGLNLDFVKNNNLDRFVRFDLGPIDEKKWWLYLSSADLVLLPYRGGLGSGIFADAMAAKKPVVASNIIYFREFAKKYDCIKIAENDGDFPRAIKESMNPGVYQRMVAGCERFVKENGLTPISKKYKKFYESLR